MDLCRVPCVKPISVPDRWDDITGVPGYMGETPRTPDWRNNRSWNHENFNDANGNRLYDTGEAFQDGNGSGAYDEELYDPSATGYLAASDLGLEIVLHPSSSGSSTDPGLFYSVMLPPVNKGTPDPTSNAYRFAWSDCQPTAVEPGDLLQMAPGLLIGTTNTAMRDLMAADPDAYFDTNTLQVLGSAYAFSPRILFVAAHDPRILISAGAPAVVVVRKVLAFFAEQLVGSAELRGRLLRVRAPGETCGGGSAGGFIVECPVPANPASWGRVKATYR